MIRPKSILFLLFHLTTFISNAQEIAKQWIRKSYIKQEADIPMHNGSRQLTAIYISRTFSADNSTLITRTPDSFSPHRENIYTYDLEL